MASSPPRRRFLPEPVEISARRSKRGKPKDAGKVVAATAPSSAMFETNAEDGDPEAMPRKFLPQPVEESSRSSKTSGVRLAEDDGDGEHVGSDVTHLHSDDTTLPSVPSNGSPSQPRRFAPEPLETSSKSSRRKFAPEPVETSARSSKDKQAEGTSKPRRKFAPEPVETSARSSKEKKEEGASKPRRNFLPQPVETGARSSKDKRDEDTPKSRRKFLPEPVETGVRSSRKKKDAPVDLTYSAEDGPAVESESSSPVGSQAPSRTSSGNRKFSPELLETAKGKYRHAVVKSPSKKNTEPESPPPEAEDGDEVSSLTESRFSAASLAKRHHEENRRKSFMVPDLPMIQSDSDDDSEAPSLTNSRSSAESESAKRKPPVPDSYTDYVLKLAAQSATVDELQNQAMAAYINERQHEPVAHFGYDDEDEVRIGKFSGDKGVDVKVFRRSSQDDLDWEMQNMRQHHEKLEKMKADFKHDVAGASRFSAAALATRHHIEKKVKKAKAGPEDDMAKMRAAASPPMAGEDLKFPYTVSPKMTRCDTDHAPRPRTNDSDDDDEEMTDNQQLWGAKVNVQAAGAGGLWMGFCHKGSQDESRPTTPLRSGIQTPATEQGNPFDMWAPGRKTPKRKGNRTPGRGAAGMWGAVNHIPPTPPRSNASDDNLEVDLFTTSIDKKLLLEKQIEDEFPDSVITQIYNYLSLGYPSLAWGFDEELSKISRITVEELRRDDLHANAKGYVGAPEGDGVGEDVMIAGGCKRWEALRLYVREWARQSPGFVNMDGVGQGVGVGQGRRGEHWGGNAAVRKGSWGH